MMGCVFNFKFIIINMFVCKISDMWGSQNNINQPMWVVTSIKWASAFKDSYVIPYVHLIVN